MSFSARPWQGMGVPTWQVACGLRTAAWWSLWHRKVWFGPADHNQMQQKLNYEDIVCIVWCTYVFCPVWFNGSICGFLVISEDKTTPITTTTGYTHHNCNTTHSYYTNSHTHHNYYTSHKCHTLHNTTTIPATVLHQAQLLQLLLVLVGGCGDICSPQPRFSPACIAQHIFYIYNVDIYNVNIKVLTF